MKEQSTNAIYLCFSTDESNKAASMLTETLKDSDWGTFVFDSPNNFQFLEQIPWHGILMVSRHGKCRVLPTRILGLHEEQGAEIGAEKGARLATAMKGLDDFLETSLLVDVFPWRSLPDGATVCDLGGGIGIISMQLADAHPNLRIVLQDLPSQIEIAKNEVWPSCAPRLSRMDV